MGTPQPHTPRTSLRPLGHPSEPPVSSPDQPVHIFSPSPSPPPGQVGWPFACPSTSTATPGNSPAVVGFHPDLVSMVPAAAACDWMRHGTAVPLGRHLLTPPSQSRRPRVRGARQARKGLRCPSHAQSRGACSPTCPSRPRRGPEGRPHGQPEQRGSSRCGAQHASPPWSLPPHSFQRPTFRVRAGATIDPAPGASVPG